MDVDPHVLHLDWLIIGKGSVRETQNGKELTRPHPPPDEVLNPVEKKTRNKKMDLTQEI